MKERNVTFVWCTWKLHIPLAWLRLRISDFRVCERLDSKDWWWGQQFDQYKTNSNLAQSKVTFYCNLNTITYASYNYDVTITSYFFVLEEEVKSTRGGELDRDIKKGVDALLPRLRDVSRRPFCVVIGKEKLLKDGPVGMEEEEREREGGMDEGREGLQIDLSRSRAALIPLYYFKNI